MVKGATPLVEAVAQEVFHRFKEQLPADLVFHDFSHTYEVARSAREIAKGMGLPEDEVELLYLAAFIHDLGYIATYEGHEEESIRLGREVLLRHGVSEDNIEIINGCIRATKMPQSPKTRLEEIMCDADLAGLGRETHAERAELLRAEWASRNIKTFTDEEWQQYDYEFLTEHRFHTAWAHINWNPQKIKNILRVRKDIGRSGRKRKELNEKLELKKKDIQRKEKKDTLPDRGIETMFRTASRTHINLSAIADNKANIMLSINALIISVVISGLAPKLDTNPSLILPTIVILAVCIVSVIFATLSTRPSVTKGRFTREDIEAKQTNLLFFGNFFNMKLEDFEWGMTEMMKDKSFLYGSLTRDLYFLGVVLAKKYRFLRITYTVFMWGLIIAVLAFAITFGIQDSSTAADLITE